MQNMFVEIVSVDRRMAGVSFLHIVNLGDAISFILFGDHTVAIMISVAVSSRSRSKDEETL